MNQLYLSSIPFMNNAKVIAIAYTFQLRNSTFFMTRGIKLQRMDAIGIIESSFSAHDCEKLIRVSKPNGFLIRS